MGPCFVPRRFSALGSIYGAGRRDLTDDVEISSSLRLKSDFREEHITELSSPRKIDLRLNAIFPKTNIVEFMVNLLNLLFVLTQEATLSKLLLPKAILF